MRTIVLGAGSTRGASFVEKEICKPPLNTDFFTQLQKVQLDKNLAIKRQVIKDVFDLFGPDFSLTLEEFFTSIEGFVGIIRQVKRDTRQFRLDRLERIRRNFMQAIASVFEESLCDPIGSKYDAQKCEFHTSLVRYLMPADTIISFNYDCLIDQHLRDFGQDKWSAKYGYGLPLRQWRVSGFESWEATPVYSNRDTVLLLKLHGSLNWRIVESSHRRSILLKQRPYTRQLGEMRFSIIPPEAHKRLQPPYNSLWEKAATALRRSEELVMIGYSFVDTDMEAMSLFRMMTNRRLRNLVIVNPDKETRRKTRRVLINSITAETSVMAFDTLSEYARYLDFNLQKAVQTTARVEARPLQTAPQTSAVVEGISRTSK